MSIYKNLTGEPWDAVEYLTTKQDVIAYLDAALAENEPQLVTAALGDIARSTGTATVAAGSGLGRESLYKSMSESGNPEFVTVFKVLNALGVRLQVVPLQ